jgi:hypothetical protein
MRQRLWPLRVSQVAPRVLAPSGRCALATWNRVPNETLKPGRRRLRIHAENRVDRMDFDRRLYSWTDNDVSFVGESFNNEMTQYEDDIVSSGDTPLLTKLGLIDEYQLLVHPVVLGGGKPLLKDIAEKQRLKLVSAKPFKSGVVLLTYQRADAYSHRWPAMRLRLVAQDRRR